MLELLIGIFTLYTLIKIYVSVMQIGFISDAKKQDPVLLLPGKYRVAANYAIKKERIVIAETFIEYLTFLFWVYGGFVYLQQITGIDRGVISDVLFLFGFFAINYLINLPFDIYRVFKLDKEFGFSKTTPKLYIIDQIKSAALFLIIGGAIFWILSWIITNFENWWIWAFAVMFGFIILTNLLYPTLIAPIFNKFTPVEDAELKSDIERILKEVGLNSNGIFTIDASKRDSRLNAYFGGLGKSKRVVLFDTLLKKLNRQEILAVLGHELGHYSHKDIFKNITLMGLFLFTIFLIAGNLPQDLFIQLKITPTAGAKIAIIALLLPIFSFIYMPVMGIVSRRNEYEADRFGAKIGGKQNLINALLKLTSENKSFPLSHPLYIFFYYSHPPIVERLKELGYDESSKNDSVLLGFLDDA